MFFNLEENAPSNSVAFCERKGEGRYVELGSQSWLEALRQSQCEQILFYIHGFNNLPEEDIFKSTKTLQDNFDQYSPGLVVVVPVIWPCDNDLGLIQDYWDDQKSADMSGFPLSRCLSQFMHWSARLKKEERCFKRMNILAHSMGARVLREMVRLSKKYDFAQGFPLLFRNIFLVAADLMNNALEHHQSGEAISELSRNVVVYYANDDFALRSSKVLNLKNHIASRRLGHTGPENRQNIPANIYSVDCDNINNKWDPPLGHSYFIEGPVFNHMTQMIQAPRFSLNPEEKHFVL